MSNYDGVGRETAGRRPMGDDTGAELHRRPPTGFTSRVPGTVARRWWRTPTWSPPAALHSVGAMVGWTRA